jgi:Polysaccharide deacetylase
VRPGLESRVIHVSIELSESPGAPFTDKLLTISLIPLGWTAHQCTTPKLAGLPTDVASILEPNTMGYGFDDGPNCTHNIFYDYLQSQNQKATMFYIGSNVLDWPLEAQRALADGHEICARQCFLFLALVSWL